MSFPKTILITGATSGLGRALAVLYADKDRHLLLSGRNAERLAEVEKLCREKGATVECKALDITDSDLAKRQITQWDEKSPIDLVIANAGISGGTGGGGESTVQAEEIMYTNILGVLNTIHPLIPRMIARKKGQIGIISSIASFRAMPGAPAYSTSKAAVRFYGEALRPLLARDGVKVSVICPGFIKTPMTDVNNFKMPFLMTAEKAANIIRRGLDQNRGRIAFPFPMYFIVWLLSILPPVMTDWILIRAPKKP